MVWFFVKYERLVEIFVKPDLRDEIRELKQGKTYDEFLRILVKNGNPVPQKHKAQASGGKTT